MVYQHDSPPSCLFDFIILWSIDLSDSDEAKNKSCQPKEQLTSTMNATAAILASKYASDAESLRNSILERLLTISRQRHAALPW